LSHHLAHPCRVTLLTGHLIRTCETVAPCLFTYMAYVCDTVVRQARGMNVPVPRVVFSTDDMRSAYQQVPLSDPEMCIVCIYCFDSGNVGPRFVENWGHNFGHTSSVSNYWRTPRLCCQAARERECCLLVLSLVSSTLPCIRQPRLRLRVLGICGFVLVCTQAFMGFLGL